jgi:hypothetical protein
MVARHGRKNRRAVGEADHLWNTSMRAEPMVKAETP